MHRAAAHPTGRRPSHLRALAVVGALAAGLTAGLLPISASAQDYPSRPIRVVVPYGPGGNTDIVARTIGQKLPDYLGQPIVFDNRGGAAGTLGVGLAAQAPADGYTLVIGDLGSTVIANHSVPSLPYRALKDFVPISLVSAVSIAVSVNPESPINSFADVLTRARAQPGKLTYGTGGVGSPGHLAMELVRSLAKVDIVHVPFKGGAQAVTAMVGGHIDFLVDGTALAQIKSGRLKAIAVTGPRLPALPDTPGIGDTVDGFSFTNWWGFLAPAGTPPGVVRRLNEAFTKVAELPEIKEKLTGLGLSPRSGSPADFGEHLKRETEKVDRIVKEAGIKFQ